MRIISGKHKGRRIELGRDPGKLIRPTSDFAREAIFNILTHSKHASNGESFIDKPVLDVFCGTGAFGLEALSRGAAHVTFVDQSREAIATARHNAERFSELNACDFLVTDASKLGTARKSYSVAFIDPPYFGKLIPPTLVALQKGGWLAADALVIIEHDHKEEVALPEGYELLDSRKYGRATVSLLRISL